MQDQGSELTLAVRCVWDRSGSTSRVSTELPAFCGGNAGGSQGGKMSRFIGLVVC